MSRDFRILTGMEEFRKKTGQKSDEERMGGASEAPYPASIEKMSEKWREIQREGGAVDSRTFVERHFLAVGLMIGLLVIALMIVIGGFAFLVWNAS